MMALHSTPTGARCWARGPRLASRRSWHQGLPESRSSWTRPTTR